MEVGGPKVAGVAVVSKEQNWEGLRNQTSVSKWEAGLGGSVWNWAGSLWEVF